MVASLAGGSARWKPGLHHASSSKGKRRREVRVHGQPAGSEQGGKETFAGVQDVSSALDHGGGGRCDLERPICRASCLPWRSQVWRPVTAVQPRLPGWGWGCQQTWQQVAREPVTLPLSSPGLVPPQPSWSEGDFCSLIWAVTPGQVLKRRLPWWDVVAPHPYQGLKT